MSKETSSGHVVEELLSSAQKALHQGDAAGALFLYQEALSIDPQHGIANYWLGVLALKSGSFPEAVACLDLAVAKHPDFPDFRIDLGLALQSVGRMPEAESSFEAARRVAPGYGRAQLSFAVGFERERRYSEAVEACKRGLILFPQDIELLRKLADLHSRNAEWSQSLAVWNRILELRPGSASLFFVFGENRFRAGDFKLARTGFQKAISLDPKLVTAKLNLGLTFQKLGDLPSALVCFREAAAANPGSSEIQKGLGDLHRELDQWPEAIEAWQRAVDLKPDYAEAWQNLGLGLETQNRLEDALACHQRVVQVCPRDANALRYLGMVLQDLGRVDEARDCYQKAIALAPKDPEIHWQIFSLMAALGEFPQAWVEHEWRWQIKTRSTPKRNFDKELWNGGALRGRPVLLHAEQGFGDTIQAARYVPLIQQMGGSVLLWCPQKLASVLETLKGVSRVFSQMRPEYAFELHLPMMSLPLVFQTTLERIPNRIPYLRAPANASVLFPPAQGRNPKIGLVWCGSLSQPQDRRPVPFGCLSKLLKMTGIDFFSLQLGDRGIRAQGPEWRERVFDLSDQLKDFGQTAAAIENLDMVITVDTAVAHLAGALGKPVWVMLPYAADWRWMLDREDSPWYPSMRLFRQRRPGDWHEVLERLCSELAGWNARWHWTATLNSWLGQGLVHHQSGRLNQAEEFYSLVLERDPKHTDAQRFMGVLFRQRGDLQMAGEWMEKALQSGPLSAQVHHDLGLIRFELGRVEEAILSYRKAIDIQPEYPEALYNLGNAYYSAHRSEDAKEAYQQAISQQPSMADAGYNLGLLAQEEGRGDRAIGYYEGVLRMDPSHTPALLNLGLLFKEAGRLDEAERCFRRVLSREDKNEQARVNLVSVLTARGDLEAAESLCLEVLETNPTLSEAWLNLGVVRQALGNVPGAIETFARAIELKPDFSDAQYNLGIAQLLVGDFPSGWANYEARWQSSVPVFAGRRFPMPPWAGEDLRGARLLVHAEQGFGDSIQFSRYVALAAERGARVFLEVPGPLVRLFGTLHGVERIVSLGEPVPECDFHLPLMSFPFRLGTQVDTVPAKVPYLAVPEGVRIALPPWSEPALKVGLAWAGNPSHGADRARSIPFGDLWPLWSGSGVRFYSLQVGPANRARAKAGTGASMVDLEPELKDFAMTAAAIEAMDLVISADTAVAHLAGALAKPVWVLLPFAPDWRWMRDLETSPWYPSARLFRQSQREGWGGVIQAVAGALTERAARHGKGEPA